jgi:parvulin-like peptidyl-prolyl isomerase
MVSISASEFQARARDLAQAFGAQMASTNSEVERRRFLLDKLLRDEATLQEARRRGYDRHQAVRQEMIARVLQDEVEALGKPAELLDADIERYYIDHMEELTRPKQVRVLQVFTRDRAVAEKAAVQARAAERIDVDAFSALVLKLSEDRFSRARGGDLGFIDQVSSVYPRAVVLAAFSLHNLYDVSDPVESERGFHVLKLVQRLPAFSPTLSQAAPDIRAKLKGMIMERKKLALASALLSQADVEIDHVELLRLPLPEGLPSSQTAPARQ